MEVVVTLSNKSANQHGRATSQDEHNTVSLVTANTHSHINMWRNRLFQFLKVEKKLLKMRRLRKITAVINITTIVSLLFSIYTSPTLSPTVFVGLNVVLCTGLILYPVWHLLAKDCHRIRDDLSSRFYASNHELDFAEDKVSLIDRASYDVITFISVSDIKLGRQAS
ncbi:hypothetical protein N9V74_03885 [Alteromonas sp.]|jgi:hypothetical protein|nr:hypothetical protein [Alteromonas sp.]